VIGGQSGLRGCDLEFVIEGDAADPGVVGVDRRQEPPFEKMPQRMHGVREDRARLDIACQATLDADPSLREFVHEGRIVHRADPVPDAGGPQNPERLADAFRAGSLARVDGDPQAGIPRFLEMPFKQPRRETRLVAGEVQARQFVPECQKRVEFPETNLRPECPA